MANSTNIKILQDLVVELSLLHEDLEKSGAQFKLLDLRSLLNGHNSSSQNNGKCV